MRYDDLLHDLGILAMIVVPVLIILVIAGLYHRFRSKDVSLSRNYNQSIVGWILLIVISSGLTVLNPSEQGIYLKAGLFLFILFVFLVLFIIYYTRVYLDEEGITIVRFARKVNLPWAEIASSYSGGVKGCNIFICLKDGREICFTSFGVSLDITEAISQHLEGIKKRNKK